jgi:hypothetical protein
MKTSQPVPESRNRHLTPWAWVPLVVLGLVAIVAAVAASSKPIGGGGERAPSTGFLDYAFTFGLVATLVLFAVVLYQMRPSERFRRERTDKHGLLASLVALVIAAGAALLILLFGRNAVGDREQPPESAAAPASPAETTRAEPVPAEPYAPDFQWVPVLLVGGGTVALAAGFVAYSRHRRRAVAPTGDAELVEELASLVHDAVDDLRAEPDARRAVIAAYARMERALSVYGLPRRPFEAPLEFLARIGPPLAGRIPAARSLVFELTHLFERAKFSKRRVDAEMKEDAIRTLEALRDELRREAAAA